MSKKIYAAADIKVNNPSNKFVKDVDISRAAFEANLISASQHALAFARELVLNILPDRIRYMVILGASYDEGDLEEGEVTYLSDKQFNKSYLSDSAEVTELLWRNGKVPEWINVSVVSEDGEYTNIKLECCGRYSDDKKHIYHAHEGRAPYHVLGPPMPPKYVLNKGEKYNLYWDRE